MPPQLEAKDLFNKKRFPDSAKKLIYLLLYTPIGIIVLVARLSSGLLALLLASALPDVISLRSTITNLLSFSLGVLVEKHGSNNRDGSVKIIVSNHVSKLDHLALHIAADSYTVTNYRMQETLENALGLININTNDINTLIQQNSDKVLTFFPEEIVTNGRGLLKFKSKLFDENVSKVQPVAIEVWRPPVADIAVHSLGSQWWSDIVAYMFVPCTLYTIKFLPVVQKNDENHFVDNLRQIIAKSLKIPLTELTASDLNEYEKRYIYEQTRALESNYQRSSVRSTSAVHQTNDPSLEFMARRVKEVLPLVPHHVIVQDLITTRNVDQTITNILDGNVRYTPETQSLDEASTSSNSSTKSSTKIQQQHTFGLFPKSSTERMQSFQERKRELIENARKRYIEKHGLNIALNTC